MKTFWTLALTLVLTAAMFTGCGCTNSEKDDASTPTGMTESMPTTPSTQMPTVPTTQTTRPTMEQTIPGNGAMEDSATGMTGTTEVTETMPESRGRTSMPGSGIGGSGSNSGH